MSTLPRTPQKVERSQSDTECLIQLIKKILQTVLPTEDMGHALLTKSSLDGGAAKESAKSVEDHSLVAASAVQLELLSSRLFREFYYCRETIAVAWQNTSTEKIGGAGMEVQEDESKIGH
ncbi:hypothetical protein HHI36_010051 [Cryptolaemus montrouzieri]|uniref:Uncharacterized protein n=1 Tax=Cryptolaemus montrouzieri TaxID=559131 RepID=A0ABD2MHS0_9CUCU